MTIVIQYPTFRLVALLSMPNSNVQHDEQLLSRGSIRRPRSRFRSRFIPYVPPAQAARNQGLANEHERNMLRQQQAWTMLKKRINGVINRINTSNLQDCTCELLELNIIRGKGVFCKSLMRAQLASIHFSAIYASLVSVLNTRIPEVTELLLHRLIAQLKRGYQENEKHLCGASLRFLAHLFTQQIIDELPLLEFLSMSLMNPSSRSAELAVLLLQECGQFMAEKSPRATEMVYSRLREILHDCRVDYRTQVLVDNVMELRRKRADTAAQVPPELNLVDDNDVILHSLSLDSDIETLNELDIFSFDKHFDDNENKYFAVRAILLGDRASEKFPLNREADSNQKSLTGTEKANLENSTNPIENNTKLSNSAVVTDDRTEADLVDFRRLVYLKIMSAASFEECAHKLVKFMKARSGMELELCNMVIECCSQEKSFLRYYGLLAQRLCFVSTAYISAFEEQFAVVYGSIHRYDTRKIRNMSTLFAFMISTEALGWGLMSIVRLTEDETTSSSRIFLKTLFIEMAKTLGKKRMKEYFEGENLVLAFPFRDVRSTRFAINFFVKIELGYVTEELRDLLNSAEPSKREVEARARVIDSVSSSSSASSSLSSSSLSSSSGLSQDNATEIGASRKRLRTVEMEGENKKKRPHS